jgi:hypothetical protein
MSKSLATDAFQVDISFDQGASFESVLVTSVAPNQYRLEESPVSAERLRFQDLIEVVPQIDGSLHFLQLIEKSTYRSFDFFLPKKVVESKPLKDLCETIMALGGNWEIAMGGLVFLHIPQEVDFDPMESMRKIVEDLS